MTQCPAVDSARSIPQRECRCPLCGRPNDCAVARSGSFDSACWCRSVEFGAELLARLPEPQRGLACICRGCATGANP